MKMNAKTIVLLGKTKVNEQPLAYKVVLTCVIIFITFFISNSVTAQVTSSALDTKNGFRDAKLGMQLASFKGLVPTGYTETSNGNKTVEYKRPSDVLKIGDIKLTSIVYVFYNNRLYYIKIDAGEEARIPLKNTFTQAYGKSRQFVKADNPDLYDFEANVSKYMGTVSVKPKGYVWDGSRVKLTMLFGFFQGKKYCDIVLRSKLIDGEINRRDAEEERRQSKKRAADL